MVKIKEKRKSLPDNLATSCKEYIKPRSIYSSIDCRQIEVTESQVQYIASDLVPFSVFDSLFFRKLLNKLGPKKAVQKSLHQVSDN